MKTYILIISVVAVLFSCDQREKDHLQSKVDSLTNILRENKKTEVAMSEVGVVLDSIDASRHILHAKIVEGISYVDYVKRLKEINIHIKDSHAKLALLENKLKNSNSASLATVRRLKSDLHSRSKEIVALQLDVVNLREKNNKLETSLDEKDFAISNQNEIITLRNANVASLEELAQDVNDKNRIKVASLYFDQAHALEIAADRTHFAPRRKKETRREALELYKLSFSLGNEKAEAKIQELEKKLS